MPGLTRAGRGGVLRHLRSGGDEGAVAVIVAIMMVVILGMAALVIDVGGIEGRRSSLQNAADAAALAVAQSCRDDGQSTVLGSCGPTARNAAPAQAATYAAGNVTDGGVTVRSVDTTQPGRVTVTVDTVQKDLFASILGTSSTPVTATATATWSVPATPLPLTFNACELPSAPSSATVLLRTDPVALAQPGCGLLTGVLNAVVPAWMADPDCALDVSAVTVVTGTLSAVIPSQCQTVVQGLVGQRVLLPVYEHPLGNVIVGCVVGGLLGSLLLGQTQNANCAIEKYAVVTLTGYDFASVDATVTTRVLLDVSAHVQIGFQNMPAAPDCAAYNAGLLGAGVLSLGQPLCQGIQGQFQGFVTPTQAASMQTAGIRLVA